jgi:hypothetical protein
VSRLVVRISAGRSGVPLHRERPESTRLARSPNPGKAPLAAVAGTQLERPELGRLPRCRHLLNLHIGRVPRRPGYLVTAAECYTA